MTNNDDMYSLEKWLEEKALEAHNTRMKFTSGLFNKTDEDAFNEVLEKIRSNRVNQRPHIRK